MPEAAKTEAPKVNGKADTEQTVEKFLLGWLPTIAELAGEMIDPKKVVKTAILMRRKQPKLRECSPESLVMALCQLTESGLEPDGVEAALVPFKGEVTAIPMFQGFAKLLYSSGLVKDVYADVFHEAEVKSGRFRYRKGTAPEIHHEPIIGNAAERGEPLGAYAVVHLATGGILVDVMNADEIEERRDVSKTGHSEDGPWAKWPLEMWKKTVFRRLAKTAPKSDQLRKALAIDSTDFDVEAQVVAREPARGTSGLRNVVGQLSSPTVKEKIEPATPKATAAARPPAKEEKKSPPASAAKEAPKTPPAQAAPAPAAESEPPRAPGPGDDNEPTYSEPPESSEAEQRAFEEGFRR